MPDTNDIDALLDLLAAQSRFGFHSALTALVAERNALKQRAAELEESTSILRWRVTTMLAEQRPAASDLRERLLESALRGAGCRLGIIDAEELGRQAMWIVNGALAAMRKGESDGK